MLSYQVSDMTCGHCASTITRALGEVDRDARVEIDLARKLVHVEAGQADAAQLEQAIRDAGYNPAPVQPVQAPAAAQARSCCGGCC